MHVCSLAGATRLPFDVALDLTLSLEKDRALVTWTAVTAAASNVINLGYINLIYYQQDDYAGLTAYHRALSKSAYQDIGWETMDEYVMIMEKEIVFKIKVFAIIIKG